MKMSNYHSVSDEDVAGVVRYMKIFHPEKADPEYCRAFLEALYSGAVSGLREVALNSPDDFEALHEKYESYLNQNTKA